MDFKVEGPWNTEKSCRPPWLTDKKIFWILDTLEWLKEYLLRKWFFFPLVSLFYLCYAKRLEGGGMAPLAPPVLPALKTCSTCQNKMWQECKWNICWTLTSVEIIWSSFLFLTLNKLLRKPVLVIKSLYYLFWHWFITLSCKLQ